LSQDQSLVNVQAFIKKERIKMKNVILKNITDKADELAREYNRTKDPKYKEEWYKILKEIPIDNNYNYPI
jgi:hypothetical protein|tara:strand:- start:1109 stop:1318 length:210 start_codon:yes stop_codon:yes gene_type:complete